MKRIVHGFLVAAVLAPLCGNAYGETMAERKQRIMRKYLRERQEVVQSDMVLPNIAEDERITESEKFKEAKVELSRQQPAARPPMFRPIPIQTRQSWILEDEDPDADPYADPFAMDSGESQNSDKGNWWTQWNNRQERGGGEDPAVGTYDYRRTGSYGAGGQTGYDYSRQQNPNSSYSYGQPARTMYGQEPDSQLGPYGTSSYGSSPSTGMLQLQAPSQNTDPVNPSTSGFTPYKSPYQTRQEQQRQPVAPPQQQQEFSTPTPYQQWKNNNQTWDPTADDAYLNELMQRNRR